MILIAATFAAMLAAQAASGSFDAERRTCTSGTREEQVGACTTLIAAGNSAGAELADLYFHRGVGYGSELHWDLAIQDYTQSLALDTHRALVYSSRAYAYLMSGKRDLALADLTAALALEPDNAVALANRGALYSEEGKYELALPDLNRSLALQPSPAGYSNRGTVYLEMDQYPQAIADFDKALTQQPENGGILSNRCRARVLWNRDLDKAADDCNRAMDLIPAASRSGIYKVRALLRIRTGDFAGAVDDANAALALDPRSPWGTYTRGLALIRLGKLDEGRADIADVNVRDPTVASKFAAFGLTP